MKIYKPYDYIDKVLKFILNEELKGTNCYQGFTDKLVMLGNSHFIANIPLTYNRVITTSNYSNGIIKQFSNIPADYKIYNIFEYYINTDHYIEFYYGNEFLVMCDYKYFKLFQKDVTEIAVKDNKNVIYLLNEDHILGIILPVNRRG